jgi:sn-glycerol 3-phosphate transport system ATP-binding protein
VSSEAPPPGGLALDITVEAVELVGPEIFVYGRRADGGSGPSSELIVRIPGQTAPAIGDQLRVVAQRGKLHLFSADGRRRLTI